MIDFKSRSKFYLNWLGPGIAIFLVLAVLPIHIGYSLNFLCSYLWAMALRSPELKERAYDRKYRFSFLRFVFFMHAHSENYSIWNKYPQHKELGRRLAGPGLFTLILFLISPGLASLMFAFGAFFFEVQWLKYSNLGVDRGPLQ